jgi:hypothetical protein
LSHDAATKLTFHDAKGSYLAEIYPRAFGFLSDGASSITVRLEAIGEGFHMASLYDPDGHVAATARHFVDFADPGRYEIELKTAVGEKRDGWSVEIYNARVLAIDGLKPWWACSRMELFNPEQVPLQSP